MVARYTCSRLDLLAPHELPEIALKALRRFKHLCSTVCAWAFQVGLSSKTMPKKVAVLESEMSSLPILSLTLASILFLRKRTACDLLVNNLKPSVCILGDLHATFSERDVVVLREQLLAFQENVNLHALTGL